MKYLTLYDNIINNVKLENRFKHKEQYYGKHHIVPLCLNGTNNKDNLVLLTAKEHFICHHLLTKIYNNKELKTAFAIMCYKPANQAHRDYKVTSIVYENAKIQHSKNMSNRIVSDYTRKKMSESAKTKVFTQEHKENMSKSRKPRVGILAPMYNKNHSQKTKDKMSIAQTGEDNGFANKKHSEESRKRMSESHKGQVISEEQRKNHSELIKTYKWFNDGIKNTRALNCPEGYKPGRTFHKRS